MTIVCIRNLVRESLHISFFCGRNPFCEVVRRPENTREELTGLLEWPAVLSLRLRDQWTSLLHLSDQQISAFSPKLHLFKSHVEVWTSSSSHVFSVYGWLSELPFFPGNLRIETSVTLSIDNKLYSHHHILYFSLLWKLLSWCYLATALNLLSLLSPAKLVHYTRTR